MSKQASEELVVTREWLAAVFRAVDAVGDELYNLRKVIRGGVCRCGSGYEVGSGEPLYRKDCPIVEHREMASRGE